MQAVRSRYVDGKIIRWATESENTNRVWCLHLLWYCGGRNLGHSLFEPHASLSACCICEFPSSDFFNVQESTAYSNDSTSRKLYDGSGSGSRGCYRSEPRRRGVRWVNSSTAAGTRFIAGFRMGSLLYSGLGSRCCVDSPAGVFESAACAGTT